MRLPEKEGCRQLHDQRYRKKVWQKLRRKIDRIAAEGLASVAINGNTAAIVEVNSETDFVAKNAEFQGLVQKYR